MIIGETLSNVSNCVYNNSYIDMHEFQIIIST